jgi:hypothetical protein
MTEKRFVKVYWHDAQDEAHTWVSDEEIPGFTAALCEVVSWGWLVGETKKYITLAADHSAPSTWGRVTKIPRGMIVKIEDFKDE